MSDENKTDQEKTAPAAESTDKPTPAGEKSAKPRKGTKNKVKKQVSLGRAYIQASYNNTIVTYTDQNGNVLAWSSAGQSGFKGPKKSTPYAASIIVKNASDKVVSYGLKEVNVFVKGVGAGRESAIRAINANGIQVLSIKDVTPIPHNGCRPKKIRRV
ncbi:MAG: 30S ribosomal protein S11 [Patescibacteria group bacterium]